MTTNVFAPVSVDDVFRPLQAISNLAAEKAGKLANLQLTALETYLAVGINQCKAAAAVHSPEDFQNLADKQAELVKLLSEKAVLDFQQLMLLGTEFSTELQSAVLEGSKAEAVAEAN